VASALVGGLLNGAVAHPSISHPAASGCEGCDGRYVNAAAAW
jgi:hypothetical protein